MQTASSYLTVRNCCNMNSPGETQTCSKSSMLAFCSEHACDLKQVSRIEAARATMPKVTQRISGSVLYGYTQFVLSEIADILFVSEHSVRRYVELYVRTGGVHCIEQTHGPKQLLNEF